uniref:Letm1 RBD domain-containing protein n=2 Tax=Parascaris univalens TaxID=6257 RepID=A0A915C7E2_PARUN
MRTRGMATPISLKAMFVMRPSCSMWISTSQRRVNAQLLHSFHSKIGYCRQIRSFSSEPPAHRTPTGLMGRYECFLKTRAPRAYTIHKMVVDGSKWCISDIKIYFALRRELASGSRSLADLTQNELEILIQCPTEILHIVVLLILLQIPIIGESLCVAIVFFPRLVLTRHFWTNEQRKDFWIASMKRSANLHFKPIRDRLRKLGITIPASIRDLRSLKTPPLEALSFTHLYHLCRIHHIIPFMGVRHLHRRANALRQLDRHLLHSEAVDAMSDQQLYLQLYLRRLQYYGMTIDEMRVLLKKWVHYSSAPGLKTSEYLHAPALFQHKTIHGLL